MQIYDKAQNRREGYIVCAIGLRPLARRKPGGSQHPPTCFRSLVVCSMAPRHAGQTKRRDSDWCSGHVPPSPATMEPPPFGAVRTGHLLRSLTAKHGARLRSSAPPEYVGRNQSAANRNSLGRVLRHTWRGVPVGPSPEEGPRVWHPAGARLRDSFLNWTWAYGIAVSYHDPLYRRTL